MVCPADLCVPEFGHDAAAVRGIRCGIADGRLADEYDAAQERGEVQMRGGDHASKVLDKNIVRAIVGPYLKDLRLPGVSNLLDDAAHCFFPWQFRMLCEDRSNAVREIARYIHRRNLAPNSRAELVEPLAQPNMGCTRR
jgi:hypothetical protein